MPSKVDQNFAKDPNIDDHEDRDRDDARLQYFCLAIDCRKLESITERHCGGLDQLRCTACMDGVTKAQALGTVPKIRG